MKKRFSLLTSTIIILLFSFSKAQQSSTFGNFYTPKGKLKVLVVCVSRMGEIKVEGGNIIEVREQDLNVSNWPNGTGADEYTTLPNWEDDLFYDDFNDFKANVYADTNLSNLSNYFYQMSGGQFQVIANFFPNGW